jgi:hypothetical protein
VKNPAGRVLVKQADSFALGAADIVMDLEIVEHLFPGQLFRRE